MKAIKYFITLINLQMIIVLMLCMAGTFTAWWFNFTAEIPTGLISVAIIFPVVFTINASYKRREQALVYFGDIKAHAVAMYYACRDWVPGGKGKAIASKMKKKFEQLFQTLHSHLSSKTADKTEELQKCYDNFSQISMLNEEMRKNKMPANEMSRQNQYLKIIMVNFERMRNIRLYRTPVTLWAFNQIFLNSFPILFAPYFAHLAGKMGLTLGFGVGVLYTVVLVGLDNIQDDLEDPYDGIGEDDLRLDIRDTYSSVMVEAEPEE